MDGCLTVNHVPKCVRELVETNFQSGKLRAQIRCVVIWCKGSSKKPHCGKSWNENHLRWCSFQTQKSGDRQGAHGVSPEYDILKYRYQLTMTR